MVRWSFFVPRTNKSIATPMNLLYNIKNDTYFKMTERIEAHYG